MLILFHFKKKYLLLLSFILLFCIYKIFLSKNEIIIIKPISQMLLIICFLIENKSSKSQKDNKKIYKFQKEKDYSKRKIIIILILIIILQIIYEYCDKFKIYKGLRMNYFIFLFYVYVIDLTKFIHQIYIHHIISMIMNFIILISLIIIQLKNIIQNYYYIPYIIIINYCYSLSFILIKYLNEKYYVNIFLISSIIGFFKFLYKSYYYLIILNNSISKINISYFLISLMINFGILFLQYYLIYKMELIYSMLALFISFCFVVIIQSILNLQNFILLFILILTIISAMIYLEILELNFCGLNNGLKDNIEARANMESKNLEMIL